MSAKKILNLKQMDKKSKQCSKITDDSKAFNQNYLNLNLNMLKVLKLKCIKYKS